VNFAKKAKWCELEPPILGHLRDDSKAFSTRAAAAEDKNVRLCASCCRVCFHGSRPANGFRVCVSDIRLLVITYEQFEQLYFQNPEFDLYLVRLIVRRFEINHTDPDVAGVSAIG
jgi:hypothetical protein